MNYLPEYLKDAGELARPDSIQIESHKPGPRHVMSRNSNGDVVSEYGDDTWNFTMFVGAGLRFNIESFIQEISDKDSSEVYRDEFKLILYRIIYNSRARALNTVAQLFNILKRHARFASRNKISIKESLNDSSMLDFIVDDPCLNKLQIGRRLLDAKVLFSSLHSISTNVIGFDLFPSSAVFKYLNELIKEYPSKQMQTPVIPTRILSNRITLCLNYIEKFNIFKEHFRNLFEFYATTKENYIVNGIDKKKASYLLADDFKREINKSLYLEFIEFYQISDYVSFRGIIGRIRLAVFEMIHAFTGMRVGESISIAMDAYKVKKVGRYDISIIRSYTTKMARDQGYYADWVTSPEIDYAFKVANYINYILLFHEYGLKPEQVDEALVPLFLSYDYRTKARENNPIFDYPIQKMKSSGQSNHPINQDPGIVLLEEDMAEILALDPYLDIDSLKPSIEIGKPFIFQTHMYRRSLAVYTARSGLVSLPTLKKQLKHVQIQTSAYYGRDAAFAKNFILPKSGIKSLDSAVISQRGFIKEFQDELIEGQVDYLFDEVITADEVVFGGMGAQIQKQKLSGSLPTVFTDRKKTRQSIKQGRLRYAETPLGGCMSIEVCDRIAFSSITTCVGCPSSVFNNKTVPLLIKTKQNYENRLSQFGIGTPYGKQLERDIRDIESVLNMREKLEIKQDNKEDKNG